MSAFKNIIIVGAASNIGPSILSALHASKSNFNLTILKRPTSTTPYPSYCKQLTSDFTPSSLLSSFQNQDVVISTVGFEGIPHQIAMIDAAIKAGVKRFIPSEFGWSKDVPMVPELAARLEVKKNSFEYLVKRCEESEGLMSWSVVASGVYFDWCIKKVPSLGFVLANQTAKIYGSGNEPISCSTSTALGQAVVGILSRPDETANRYLKISSFKTTQNQLLDVFETVTEKKWDVKHVSFKEILEQRGELLKEKRFPEVFMGVVAVQVFEDGKGRGVTVEVAESDNLLLGVEEENVLEVVKGLV